MQPLRLTLKGFRGIRDGLGRDEITLDLERLADGANLIAIVGANGSGKSTIMDCLTPFMGLPSRVALAGAGGFSYYDHVYAREFFVSQTPELTAMADAVIDLDAMCAAGCSA